MFPRTQIYVEYAVYTPVNVTEIQTVGIEIVNGLNVVTKTLQNSHDTAYVILAHATIFHFVLL